MCVILTQHTWSKILDYFFLNCWFIVNSTQYMQYRNLQSLMVGKFHKPLSICMDMAPRMHTAASQDRTHDIIGIQLVDIGRTTTVDWATDNPLLYYLATNLVDSYKHLMTLSIWSINTYLFNAWHILGYHISAVQ